MTIFKIINKLRYLPILIYNDIIRPSPDVYNNVCKKDASQPDAYHTALCSPMLIHLLFKDYTNSF